MVYVRWVLKQTQRAEAFFTAISQRNKARVTDLIDSKTSFNTKKTQPLSLPSTYWFCDTVILSWCCGVCRKCDSKFLDNKSIPWCSLYNPCCNAVIIVLTNTFVADRHSCCQTTWRISQIVFLKLKNFCEFSGAHPVFRQYRTINNKHEFA